MYYLNAGQTRVCIKPPKACSMVRCSMLQVWRCRSRKPATMRDVTLAEGLGLKWLWVDLAERGLSSEYTPNLWNVTSAVYCPVQVPLQPQAVCYTGSGSYCEWSSYCVLLSNRILNLPPLTRGRIGLAHVPDRGIVRCCKIRL